MHNLSIDFYDESSGGVKIDWGENTSQAQDPKVRRFADGLLLGCYILKQMRNLGNHPTTDVLADKLAYWRPDMLKSPEDKSEPTIFVSPFRIMHDAALKIGMSFDEANKRYGDSLLLVPHNGAGKKQFLGRLKVASSQQPVFTLEAKGFGLFGWNISSFAGDSVLLMLAYLAKMYQADDSFLKGMTGIAMDSAQIYHSNAISGMNFERLALASVVKHIGTA